MTNETTPTGRRVTRLVKLTFSAAVVAILAAGSVAILSTGALASSHDKPQAPKPTVVLVHSAWADGSSWGEVVKRLQHDGYTVDVPANPLRGLAADSAYLADFLKTVPGPIILVGHSYGGAVITNAAAGNPNVKALVYVDAYMPDEGETVVQLTGAQPGSVFAVADLSTVFNFAPYPGAPSGDADLYVKPELFRNAFAADLSAKDAAVLASTQRAVTGSALNEPSGAPAWKTIPS